MNMKVDSPELQLVLSKLDTDTERDESNSIEAAWKDKGEKRYDSSQLPSRSKKMRAVTSNKEIFTRGGERRGTFAQVDKLRVAVKEEHPYASQLAEKLKVHRLGMRA